MDRIKVLENEIEELKNKLYIASDRMTIHMKIEEITEELKVLKFTQRNFHLQADVKRSENNSGVRLR